MQLLGCFMNICKMKDLCRIIFFLKCTQTCVFSHRTHVFLFPISTCYSLFVLFFFVLFFESWNHVSFFVAWCHTSVHFPEPDNTS